MPWKKRKGSTGGSSSGADWFWQLYVAFGYDAPKVSGLVAAPSDFPGHCSGDFVTAMGDEADAFAAVLISGDPIEAEASYAEALAAVEAAP